MLVIAGACAALGCGDEAKGPVVETPANLAGDYSVDLTNEYNDCATMVMKWMDGAVSEDVPFTITQNGVHVSAETMGAPAIAFLLLTGSLPFEGEIHGSHFLLVNTGTKLYDFDACSYTINATVEGDVDGDTITGTLVYSPVVGDDPACHDYACRAEQSFTGTRPTP